MKIGLRHSSLMKMPISSLLRFVATVAATLLCHGAHAFNNYQEYAAWCISAGGIPASHPASCHPRPSPTASAPRVSSAEQVRREKARDVLRLGNEAYRSDDYEDALRLFQEADALSSTDASRHNIELTKEAIRSKRARELFDEGLDAQRGGYYERAVRLWDKVLELDPDNEAARSNRKSALAGRADSRQQQSLSRNLPDVLDRVLGTGTALRQAQGALASLLLTGDAHCPYDSAGGCVGLAGMPPPPSTPRSTETGFRFAAASRENPTMQKLRVEISATATREKDLQMQVNKETDRIRKMSLERQLAKIGEDVRQRQREYQEEDERVNRGVR